MTLGNLTLPLLSVFFSIYVAAQVMVFNFSALRLVTSLLTFMLIGLAGRVPIDLHPDIESFWETFYCLGHRNIQIPSLGLVQKQDIEVLQTPL